MAAENCGKIVLQPGREASVLQRHPWLFSGAIKSKSNAVQDNSLVEVFSAADEYLGSGYYNSGSIAVRFLRFAPSRLSQNWIPEHIAAALSVRRALGLFLEEHTNSFRLVNAEGDMLPGLIIDRYGSTIVIQTHNQFMTERVPSILESLRAELPELVSCIMHRIEAEGGRDTVEIMWGDNPVEQILEQRLKYFVDLREGHKTGFYLDQRENRALVGLLSPNRRVLNAFCYSGGFSVAALKGGAAHVTSVDSSKGALALLEKNIVLNEVTTRHRIIADDYLSCMKTFNEGEFDLIVLDPPAFIKNRNAVRGGISGYRAINLNAIQKIVSGGFLFTFSCSQFLSMEQFREIVASAAAQSKRNVRLLRELGAASCHARSIYHPEGTYLKGLLLHVV